MEEQKNLEQLSADISDKLLNSIEILKIIKMLTYEVSEIEPLIRIIDDNICNAFKYIEGCRHLISNAD